MNIFPSLTVFFGTPENSALRRSRTTNRVSRSTYWSSTIDWWCFWGSAGSLTPRSSSWKLLSHKTILQTMKVQLAELTGCKQSNRWQSTHPNTSQPDDHQRLLDSYLFFLFEGRSERWNNREALIVLVTPRLRMVRLSVDGRRNIHQHVSIFANCQWNVCEIVYRLHNNTDLELYNVSIAVFESILLLDLQNRFQIPNQHNWIIDFKWSRKQKGWQ